MADFFSGIFNTVSTTHVNMVLFLGIVLFGGALGGRLFQKIKIPQVVGYIVIGVILGQSGLKFIGPDMVTKMAPVSTVALSLIGFSIGGELKISVLKQRGKQFAYILVFEAITAFIVVGLLVYAAVLIITKDQGTAISLGLLLGAISSATAPAATTDVLWENRTKGPLTTTVLGIVAMDDAVALLLFAFATSIAAGFLDVAAGADISVASQLLSIVIEIVMSIGVGAAVGYLLSKLIRGFINEERILAFSLGAIMLLSGLCVALDIDMILAAMSMGFFMTNFAPRKSRETFALVQKFSPPIYVLFFVLVGAKLNIWSITPVVAVLAGVFLIGRTGGKFIGAKTGAFISKAPKTVYKYLPFCLLSQAGVAIGLSIVAGDSFTGPIGDLIVTVVTATTFVVQLLGPISVKFAVDKAGETGLNITEEDLIKQSSAKDLMFHNLPTIPEGAPVSRILHIFSENEALCFPVTQNDGSLAGVISIDDLKNTFMAAELSDFLLAHDIMKPSVITCSEDTPADEVKLLFRKYSVDYIPVLSKDGSLKGIIEERGIQLLFSKKLAELNKKAEDLG